VNANALTRQYSGLTAEERFRLMAAAAGRLAWWRAAALLLAGLLLAVLLWVLLGR
jgi:hypothetical protein